MYEQELKDLEKSYEWLENCCFPDKDSCEDWKHVEDRDDGTTIHKHKKHSTVLVRGHATIRASADEILQYLSDMTFDVRKRWDQQCVAMRELERFGGTKFGDYKVIGYTKFPSPSPLFSSRDFVFIANVKRKGDLLMLNSQSFQDDEKFPTNHGVVRGSLNICGWIVKPRITEHTIPAKTAGASTDLPTTSAAYHLGGITDFCDGLVDRSDQRLCDVWYVSQVDLKGWIPEWATTYTAIMMVGCLPKFKVMIEKISSEIAERQKKLAAASSSHHGHHNHHHHHYTHAHVHHHNH